MSDLITHVSHDSFQEEVINSKIPVLVDYWATWCGPCRLIAPLLDEMSREYDGQVKICKVDMDVDSNREVAARYNVQGIPTLIMFKNGVVEAVQVGALSKSQLTDFIESNK